MILLTITSADLLNSASIQTRQYSKRNGKFRCSVCCHSTLCIFELCKKNSLQKRKENSRRVHFILNGRDTRILPLIDYANSLTYIFFVRKDVRSITVDSNERIVHSKVS